jgi:hypothetical protein
MRGLSAECLERAKLAERPRVKKDLSRETPRKRALCLPVMTRCIQPNSATTGA